MIPSPSTRKRFVVKHETIYMICSLLLYLYFLVATFGAFGEVKDRSNYNETFDNLVAFSSELQLITGSSLLYGVFSIFGDSYLMLSIYSAIFFTIKIFLLRNIFRRWSLVFLYLVKFAFVIDLILLKESLALLFILAAYSSRHLILRYVYFLVALLSHLSVALLAVIKIEKRTLLIIAAIVTAVTILSSSEIEVVLYYLDKLKTYNVDTESFLYENPIFWMSAILLFCSLSSFIRSGKGHLTVIAAQTAVFVVGLLHPVIGVPAFRIWQVGSFVDLIALRTLHNKLVFAIYLFVNLSFMIYGTIILRGYLV